MDNRDYIKRGRFESEEGDDGIGRRDSLIKSSTGFGYTRSALKKCMADSTCFSGPIISHCPRHHIMGTHP